MREEREEREGRGEGGGEEISGFISWATKTCRYITHVMLAHTLAAAILVLGSLT